MRRRELLTSISDGPSSGTSNGYDWFDIGGVKWATKNVEAATETDYGLYFSWGETNGYETASAKTYVKGNTTYTGFTWGSYKYISGSAGTASNLTKYTSSDGLTQLELVDDAANANVGDKWRMPTFAECQELTANTTNTWVTDYNGTGVSGRLFTSISNPNVKLFFPAAGYCGNATVFDAGSYGNYWSSSLSTSNRLNGRNLYFHNREVGTYSYGVRYIGRSVRGVYDETLPDITYEYVDLGLPSGLLWCKQNVGARSETNYGQYFQWGDTQGYYAGQVGSGDGKKSFTWTTYKYNNDGSSPSESNMSKYNGDDGLTVLGLEDDAARANMGGNWRMPTEAECRELSANTTSAWTTVNGVHGLKLTSKKYTSKYIFFPAAGYCNNATVYGTGSYGNYWSSSLSTSGRLYGRLLGFDSSNVSTYDYSIYRYYGRSVRGVMPSS